MTREYVELLIQYSAQSGCRGLDCCKSLDFLHQCKPRAQYSLIVGHVVVILACCIEEDSKARKNMYRIEATTNVPARP